MFKPCENISRCEQCHYEFAVCVEPGVDVGDLQTKIMRSSFMDWIESLLDRLFDDIFFLEKGIRGPNVEAAPIENEERNNNKETREGTVFLDNFAKRGTEVKETSSTKRKLKNTVKKRKNSIYLKRPRKRRKEGAEKVQQSTLNNEDPPGRQFCRPAKRCLRRYCTFILPQMRLFMRFLLIGLLAKTASASSSCAASQTAELGGRGIIDCTFPDSFTTVRWYNNVRDGSLPLIVYTPQMEDKTELCSENVNYDVAENGSLIICNVTVRHENNYTVFLYTTTVYYTGFEVSLKVIVSPGSRSISVGCHDCHGGRYHQIHLQETLSCSFEKARPPVSIEWGQRYPQGDFLINSTQDVQVTNNTDGTYNTSMDLHLVSKRYFHIAVFVCRANYLPTGWKRESEILLDFSKREFFAGVPNSTVYFETRRKAKLRCGTSKHDVQIWKILHINGEPKTIGFRFGNSTEMIKDIDGIEISPEGSLIFSLPQVHHEGDYVCVYSDGVTEGIQKTTVVIMIAPSPPYIKIAGCDDAEYTCVKKEGVIQEVSCSVDGIYPNATLAWVASDPSQVSIYNYTSTNTKYSQEYDISASVEFMLSDYVTCDKEIYIECRLQGPTSRIIKSERLVRLLPKKCEEYSHINDYEFKVLPFMLGCALGIWLVSFATCLLYFRKSYKRRRRLGGRENTSSMSLLTAKGDVNEQPGSATSWHMM